MKNKDEQEPKKLNVNKSKGLKLFITTSLIAGGIALPAVFQIKQAQAMEQKVLAKEAKKKKSEDGVVETPLTTELSTTTTADNTAKAADENEIEPTIGVSTGFNTKFNNLTASADGIRIASTSSQAISLGIVSQFVTKIVIDPALAPIFDSGVDMKPYISGSMDTTGGIGIGNDTANINSMWNRKPNLFEKKTANWDSATHSIMLYGNVMGINVSKGWQNIDMTINLKQFTEDTGIVVESQPNYTTQIETATAGWDWGLSTTMPTGTLSYSGFQDSWVENIVKPTTVESPDGLLFFGNGFNDGHNRHDSNYIVSIDAQLPNGGGTVNVAPAVPMDEKGNWNYQSPSQYPKGTVMAATVIGKEKESGIEVRSARTSYTIGNETVPFDKWKIATPTISQSYDGDLSISGGLPEQNIENNRTYQLVVEKTATDGTVSQFYTQDYTDPQTFIANVLADTLHVGEKYEAYIIGSENVKNPINGEVELKTKTSDRAVMTVEKEMGEWIVNEPVLDEVSTDDQVIHGTVPAESAYNNRSYEVAIYKNDESTLLGKLPIAVTGGGFNLPIEGFELEPHDKIIAKVIGHEPNAEDRVSEEVVQEVEDDTNWDGWQVLAPTLNDVNDSDKEITGTIPEESTEFGRTYALITKVNGEEVSTTDVASGQDYAVNIEKLGQLKENDEVSVQVVGKQEDRNDKNSDVVTKTVKDASDWANWTVADPTVNDVFDTDREVSGVIPAQSTDFGRSYQVEVKVNDIVAKKQDVAADTAYTVTIPDEITLKENDTISVQILGTQPGKESKQSQVATTTVQKRVYQTTSKFEQGYWENYGLVYEGQIDNQSWDLSNAASITKEVQVVNDQGAAVKSLAVSNTDWYEAGKYNGYQFVIDNDTLGNLPVGQYHLNMIVSIDGTVVAEQTLDMNEMISRMGPIHNNYAELESVTIMKNIVSPTVIENHPGFTIAQQTTDEGIKLFNKYFNDANQLVFDGYFATSATLTGSVKNLNIMDQSGKVVYTKEALTAAPTSWGTPTGVDDLATFQAIIPAEYSNQATYRYSVDIVGQDGTIILTNELN